MAKKLDFEKGNPQMLGITQCDGGHNFTFISEYDEIELKLYRLKTKELYCEINFELPNRGLPIREDRMQ